jgi:hypothetical protein
MKFFLKSSLKIVPCQLKELVSDLNEREQESISGSGGRDDCWCTGFTSRKIQKNWLASNFKV